MGGRGNVNDYTLNLNLPLRHPEDLPREQVNLVHRFLQDAKNIPPTLNQSDIYVAIQILEREGIVDNENAVEAIVNVTRRDPQRKTRIIAFKALGSLTDMKSRHVVGPRGGCLAV